MSNHSLMDTHVPAIKRVNGAGLTPSGDPYGLFSAEAYVVLTPEPVLVDCGGPPTYPELRDNLAGLGVAPVDVRRIVATHYHADHTGNTVALRRAAPQVEFAIHAADADLWTASTIAQQRADATLARVDVPLADGQRFTAGRAKFEVHHTPGHTPGSAAILVDIDGVRAVFVGDTVHGLYFARQGNDVWADMQRWAHALGRLLACPFDLMFDGHVLPVHVLANPSSVSDADKADFYQVLERRMHERRRGIWRAEASEIIAAQQRVTEAGLLITPETWITELSARRASARKWEA